MPKLDEAKERLGACAVAFILLVFIFLGGRQIKAILREIKDLKK